MTDNTIDKDLYIKFRKETDLILKFNLFLELYCPDDYAHLIDSDDNGGEFMRQAIAEATKKAEVRGRIDEINEVVEGFKAEYSKLDPRFQKVFAPIMEAFENRLAELQAQSGEEKST